VRATIDSGGRLTVPKKLRDELGLKGATDLELEVADGRLVAAVPSKMSVEEGPHGLRLHADVEKKLTAAEVRKLTESIRR
jgi:AbrB family looped-hinge helix DNA binding protein